jgi:hypothetical protein
MHLTQTGGVPTLGRPVLGTAQPAAGSGAPSCRSATRRPAPEQAPPPTGSSRCALAPLRRREMTEDLFDVEAATGPRLLATLLARHGSTHTPKGTWDAARGQHPRTRGATAVLDVQDPVTPTTPPDPRCHRRPRCAGPGHPNDTPGPEVAPGRHAGPTRQRQSPTVTDRCRPARRTPGRRRTHAARRRSPAHR